MYNIIQKRKVWYSLSLALLVPGTIALVMGGLRLGIDFKGGSLIRLQFSSDRPSITEMTSELDPVIEGEFLIQPIETRDISLRVESVDESQKQTIIDSLTSTFGPVTIVSSESIGPTIGAELRQKSVAAIIVVLALIIAYIAFAFRKVTSGPVRSWVYGLVAVIALMHDVLFVIGVFAILGMAFRIEVSALFVTALLTTLGFSVHDTIVVFDRIRERLRLHTEGSFEHVVNLSINQTLVRSINTSVTTLLVLFALYLFGGDSIKTFVLALILGITVGTYSSIFVASPLLVTWQKIFSRAGER